MGRSWKASAPRAVLNTMEKLAPEEIATRLERLPEWSLKDGKLHRRFEFADFERAFEFMTAVALVAERLQHHPEWTNVYRTVDVSLTTHDAGGLTALDFDMAREMDAIARPEQ